MLRKDVKLGFAIGGVMLAVVVVYVLVVPNNERKGAQLVVDETQTNATATPASPKPEQTTPEVKPTETKTADSKSTDSDVKPDNVGEPRALVAISGSTDQPTTAPSAAKGDVWDVALRDGVIPPSMSATPTNTPAPSDRPTAQKQSDATSDKPADKQTSLLSNQPDAAIADPGSPDAAADAKLAGDTQPKATASTGEQTHVVRSGETLSSIAAASYGDAKSWKLIAAANPTINPNRLSAGTHLVIPPATAAASGKSNTATALALTPVDSKTQYQVQPNDSLYRISVKLYGKADHFDKLYQDNKDMIGEDPRRLKVGMVLKLTDPPVSVARAI